MNRVHVISGGNGFLGSQLIVDLLKEHPHDGVLAFARAADGQSANERLMDEVKQAAYYSGTALKLSDLSRICLCEINPFGDDSPSMAQYVLQSIEESGIIQLEALELHVWHLAASVSFFKADKVQIYAINFDGARNFARLAVALGVAAFNYISTAYVSGRRSGLILEQMEDEVPEFNNPYESSKFYAEREICNLLMKNAVPLRIFRPSIIVGHSRTGCSSSETGIYGYAMGIAQFWDAVRHSNGGRPLTLVAPEDATVNFVCVDQCTREMIALANLPVTTGKVFHLTDEPLSVRNVIALIGRLLDVPLIFTDIQGEASLSRQDKELARRLANSGADYSRSHKAFSRVRVQEYATQLGLDPGPMSLSFMETCLRKFLQRKLQQEHVSREATLFTFERRLHRQFNISTRVLEQAPQAEPTLYALRHASGDIFYGELEQRVYSYIGSLNSAGVAPGERVALVAIDSVHLAISLLALLHRGCLAIIINPLLKEREIAVAYAVSGAVHLLLDASQTARLNHFLPEINSFSIIEDFEHSYRQQIERGTAIPAWEAAPATPFGHAFGMFTSGTTGEPKLVLHRHQDFMVAAERYAAQILNIDQSDTVLSASRLSFAFGLHNMFNALLNGATSVLSPPTVNGQTLVQAIIDYQPTVVFAVPTLYQFVLKSDLANSAQLLSVRLFVAAGERLPEEINRQWRHRFGLPILDSLGSTEVFSTYLSNLPGVEKPNATGKLIPGFDAKLVDEAGKICGINQIGTLWIRGPSLLGCYENSTRANQLQFENGWFCTSDVFWREPDGYYYYYGRSDDLFKVSGQWISPQEIENVLLRHPDVLDAAVVPVGDCSITTRPKAYIVSDRPGTDTFTNELKEFSQQRLQKWKYPHLFEFIPELPKTTTGKIRRFALRPASPAIESVEA
jgi:acyl-coenzyme A synthetase/AMP-(fatty) acid ligase/nucleoside-diphosphate-sugar epimerase